MNSAQEEYLRFGRENLEGCARVAAHDCGEPMLLLPENPHLWKISPSTMSMPMLGSNNYLRKSVLEKVFAAAEKVQSRFSGRYKLHILGTYRPPVIQKIAHAFTMQYYRLTVPALNAEDAAAFVNSFTADPRYAGHPCGAALDASLWDIKKNRPVGFGNPLKDIYVGSIKNNPAGDKPALDLELLENFQQCFLDLDFKLTPCEWWHFCHGDYEWAYLTGNPVTLYQPFPWRIEMFAGKKIIER